MACSNERGCSGSGFIIIIVIYVLLAIILGNCFSY